MTALDPIILGLVLLIFAVLWAAAIVRGGPYGNQLVRINVPAEKK